MKKLKITAALCALLLLTGCASLLERQYSTVEPHSSKFWESEAADTLRAENHQDLVNDLLLLIDEVQTGIGRTGSLFCFQQYGIKPDVVSMAKGLGGGVPIGAVMAADTCDTVLGPGTHATTFGGTPMICAAANAVLSEVTQPEFLKSVTEKGEYLKAKILGFGSDKVKDVRGMGLMLGIVVDADARAALVKEIMDAGVLVLTAGTNAIRLLPPLSISYEEMDEALAVMQKVFCK